MQDYSVKIGDNEYEITGQDITDMDIRRSGDGSYHLIHEGKSYTCRVNSFNPVEKTMTVSINGRQHDLKVGDEYDQLVSRLGFATSVAAQNNDIMAPMPGLILDIMVKDGQEVSAGTPLLILEAMKMENVIKAEGEGVVKAVLAKQGEAVEKRQLLIEME